MDITFFYKNNQHSYKHEVIITSFSNAVSKVISLPDNIEICLYPLDNNVYGGIDRVRVNRIGINYNIPIMTLPKILTHELIHVNQKHTGLLRIGIDGMCYWRNIPYTNKLPEDMSYDEYQNLPWELDVIHRQQEVFKKALALVDNKSS